MYLFAIAIPLNRWSTKVDTIHYFYVFSLYCEFLLIYFVLDKCQSLGKCSSKIRMTNDEMLCLESRSKRAVDDTSLQETTSEATVPGISVDDISLQESTSEATVPEATGPGISVYDISLPESTSEATESLLPYWNGSIPRCVGESCQYCTHNGNHIVISHSEMSQKLCNFLFVKWWLHTCECLVYVLMFMFKWLNAPSIQGSGRAVVA